MVSSILTFLETMFENDTYPPVVIKGAGSKMRQRNCVPSKHPGTIDTRGVPAYTQSTQLRTSIFECPKNKKTS